MDKTETAEALAAIGMMLQAFPSAQSSITADSAKVYLFAVEEFSLEALKRACRAIVRGEVADLKPEFPPAAPKLAQIVKLFEDRIKREAFEAAHTFIEQDSMLWRKMEYLRRDKSLPSYERSMPDGRPVRGWFFTNTEVREAETLVLPPPVSAQEMAEINGRLRALGFSVGDPDGDEAAA